jgi:hypothetical protein
MAREDPSVKSPPRAALVVLLIAAAALLVAGLSVAMPAAGADPSAKPSQKADRPKSDKPAQARGKQAQAKDKAEKADQDGSETTITVRGPIAKTTDAEGETGYTLTANGKTYRLEVGPPWWWGANDPLASKVGGTHEVTGEVEGTANELEVFSIDGTTVRSPGKPPWAGGPKVVGERHPGWKAWNAAHNKAKGPKGPKEQQRDENEGPTTSPAPNGPNTPSPSPEATGSPSASDEPSTQPSPSTEPSASTEPSPSSEASPSAESSPSTEASPSTESSPSAEPSALLMLVLRGGRVAF